MEISLRDYLAAHAPATPQPWFTPQVITRPPEPPLYPDEETLKTVFETDHARFGNPAFPEEDRYGFETIDHVKEALDGWCRDAVFDIDEEFEVLMPWCDAWRDYWESCAQYGESVRKAALVQWPYAWADAVIAADRKMGVR